MRKINQQFAELYLQHVLFRARLPFPVGGLVAHCLKRRQNRRIVWETNDDIRLYLYRTPLFSFDGKYLTICRFGWHSPTTNTMLGDVCRYMGLPYIGKEEKVTYAYSATPHFRPIYRVGSEVVALPPTIGQSEYFSGY